MDTCKYCIRPIRKYLGFVKAFNIGTGKVFKQRKTTEMLMPGRVLNSMNTWGEISKFKEYGNKLEFLNWTKVRYDWDNDEIEDDEGLI